MPNEELKPALRQTDVGGSIVINRGRNDNYRHFKVNSKWFEDAEYYSFIERENYLEIRKHYLDVPKSAQISLSYGVIKVSTFVSIDKREIR